MLRWYKLLMKWDCECSSLMKNGPENEATGTIWWCLSGSQELRSWLSFCASPKDLLVRFFFTFIKHVLQETLSQKKPRWWRFSKSISLSETDNSKYGSTMFLVSCLRPTDVTPYATTIRFPPLENSRVVGFWFLVVATNLVGKMAYYATSAAPCVCVRLYVLNGSFQ